MDDQTREALTNRASWLKGAALLLFYLLLVVATPVLIVTSLIGWIGLLTRGQVPSGVRNFGWDLACWFDQTARYLTGNASRRPFPFEDLDCPSDEPVENAKPSTAGYQGRARSESAAESSKSGIEERADPGPDHRKPASEKKKAVKKKSGKKAKGEKKSGKKKSGKKKSAGKSASGKTAKKKSTTGRKKTGKAAVNSSNTSPSEPTPSSGESSEGGRNE